MLTPEAVFFLHTSPPWAAVTLFPAWDQPWLALAGECHANSPRNHLYPPGRHFSRWSARQGLEVGLQTCHTLSSHAVIFTHFKSCLLQSCLPATILSPFCFRARKGASLSETPPAKQGNTLSPSMPSPLCKWISEQLVPTSEGPSGHPSPSACPPHATDPT